MEGITPVIAIILLLLITISIVGFAFVFFARTTETAAASGEEQLKQQTASAGTTIRIDTASENKIYVRNTGTVDMPSNSLKAFVDGTQVDLSSDPLGKGSFGTVTLDMSKLPKTSGEHTLKVTSGGNTDTLKINYPVVGVLNIVPFNSGGAGAPTATELDSVLNGINVAHELVSDVNTWADNMKTGKYDIVVVPYNHDLPVFKTTCTVNTGSVPYTSSCQGDPNNDIWIITKNFISGGGTFIGSWAIPFYCFDYWTGSGWTVYKGASGSEYSAGNCCGGCGSCPNPPAAGCFETPERFYTIGFGSPAIGAWCGEWCWANENHIAVTQESSNIFSSVPAAAKDPAAFSGWYRTTGNLDYNFFAVHDSSHNLASGNQNLLYGGAKKYGSGYFIWMSGTSLFDPSDSPQANNAWRDLIKWIYKQKK